MGHVRFLVFYILCGLAAAAAQTFVNPSSAIPMVGASGAISGVMGAYIVLYPRVQVHMLIFLGSSSPGSWCRRTSCSATGSCSSSWADCRPWANEDGGVAFWAHAGGFVAGALPDLVFKDPDLVAQHRALARYRETAAWGHRDAV